MGWQCHGWSREREYETVKAKLGLSCGAPARLKLTSFTGQLLVEESTHHVEIPCLPTPSVSN